MQPSRTFHLERRDPDDWMHPWGDYLLWVTEEVAPSWTQRTVIPLTTNEAYDLRNMLDEELH